MRQTDSNIWKVELIDRLDGRMEGWKDGRMEGWMDGRTDIQTDQLTDRQTHR
jgi:hypothetical protein